MQKNLLLDKKTLVSLEGFAQQLIELRKNLRIGTSTLTPLNYTDEMEKFFKSNTYNPKYIYKKQTMPDFQKKINELKMQLQRLNLPTDISSHLYDYLQNQENVYLTKKSVGKNDFSINAHKLFDWGLDNLDNALEKTPKVKFKIQLNHILENSDSIKRRFEMALSDYKINSFQVEIDEFSTHIINAGYKNIGIGAEIKRFGCNVDRLITHEIESHVLQTENLKNANSPLVELSTYKNQNLFAEGLAVYNEILSRKITPGALEMYFHRVKAVSLLSKSFREIFEILAHDLPIKKAYVMTYRVKRGLSDTSKPGGFPKDASYLLGYYEIEKLLKEGFSKKLLYATKSPVLTKLLLKYDLIETDKLIIPKFY